MDYDGFVRCLQGIVHVSEQLGDGWHSCHKEGHQNGAYITKKYNHLYPSSEDTNTLVVFEFHIAFNINYGVPILCFIAWKQDGSLLKLEEYHRLNNHFGDSEMLSTLTQLDHPVLCRPFFTLHPCKTHEIIAPFLAKSKNPVVSWLSVVAPFVDLPLDEEYSKVC